MYAKHKIGLIVSAQQLAGGQKEVSPRLTSFIDRIYVVSNGVKVNDVIMKTYHSDDRIQFVDFTPDERGSFPDAGFTRAIEDGIDISVVVDGEEADPILLSYILDPIVWGLADYTTGKQFRPQNDDRIGPTHASNYIQLSNLAHKNLKELDFSNKTSAVSMHSIQSLQGTTSGRHRVIAAIPCYDEGVTIGSVVLQARNYVDDVVVIDDGSTDDTVRVAKEAGVTVISHPHNQGKAAAIATAVRYAKNHHAEILVLLDGDGQHDPEEIPRLLSPIQDGKADLVIGSRYLNKENRIPRHRKFGQHLLTFLTNAVSHHPVTDSQSGFRALSSKAIQEFDIRSEGFNIETDMITQFSVKDLTIAEVPITAIYDVPYKHTLNPLYHGYDIVSKIIGEIGYRRPLLMFSISGCILILAGIGVGFWAFTTYYVSGRVSFILTMASGILLIQGMLLLAAGLILNSLIYVVKQKI